MYQCIYCLRSLKKAEKTVDHVIASSWFTETTPHNIEKWRVPSCRSCNHKYGRFEDDIGLRMAMCVDPEDPAAAGIYAKAKRAIDPTEGRNEKDRLARKRKREKLLGEFRVMRSLPTHGLLPSFQPNWDNGSRLAIFVSAKDLESLVKKWVRGIHYLTLDRLIKRDDDIDILHVRDDVADEAFREIKHRATFLRKGPGVVIMQATASEKGESMTLYGFEIWGQYRVYASVDEDI